LLVLDGFFDFTPVQGEMLRLLIPQIPDVIVNLNRDERNMTIFRPFERLIDQLKSIADFMITDRSEVEPVAGGLSLLRERLFNPLGTPLGAQASLPASSDSTAPGTSLGAQASLPASSDATLIAKDETASRQGCLRSQGGSQVIVLDCSDRQTELRSIAKE